MALMYAIQLQFVFARRVFLAEITFYYAQRKGRCTYVGQKFSVNNMVKL